ncbi:MAG: lipopolysaccharide biosynthesis protein [Alphaproteobacteria bacterium]
MSSPFDPPSEGMRNRVARGAVVTAAAQSLRILIQLGSVVLLSRLLAPSDFGLVAMVAPVFALALLLQELGLSQATVQKPGLSHDEVSVLFWVNLAAGLGIAAILIAVSPLVGWFYEDPRAMELTAAMSAIAVINGAGAQHLALLNRRMRFGLLAAINAVSAVVTLAASALFAVVDPTFWAIFFGVIAGAGANTLGGWIMVRWVPALPRRGVRVGGLLRFGAGVTGFNLTNFFARNLDNVLIGRVWGDAALGMYDRAYKLLLSPLVLVNNPMGKVMMPTLSRLAGEPARYRSAYLKAVCQSLLITLPGVAFMTGSADLLVPVLLGDGWDQVSPILTALGFAGLMQPLNNCTGWLFMSQGRGGEFARIGLFSAATAIGAFIAGLPYGPLGVAIAYAVSEYIRTPIVWWYVGRKGPVGYRDVARAAGPQVLAAFGSLGVVGLIMHAVSAGPALKLSLCLVASYLASALIIAAFPLGRRTIGQSIQLGRALFGAKV